MDGTAVVARTRVAVYARISRDDAGDGLGVKRQIDDCRSLAAARDWDVVQEFIDNDVSAYGGRRRPAYEQMLSDARTRRFHVLLAWHPDRFHRNMRELEDFISVVEEAGLHVETATAGRFDLSTPAGRFMARQFAAGARYESEHRAERIRRKHQELAMAGKVSGGGTRPYGFQPDRRTVEQDEAREIRELARRLLAGESLRALTLDLNQRGVATVTGKPWTAQVVRRLLMSARISGQRSLGAKSPGGGEIVAQAEWPAIVSAADTARLRSLLTDRTRATTRVARRYLLTHLLRCHRCGVRMVARPRGDRVRRYVCPGPRVSFGSCGKTFILAEPLEALVAEMALIRLDSQAFEEALRRANAAEGQATDDDAVAADRSRLDELASLWADGNISTREYLSVRARLVTRIHDAEQRAARQGGAGTVAPLAGSARKLWPQMTFDQQRAVLRALFTSVVIGPGRRGFNRFDPSRAEPEWRI